MHLFNVGEKIKEFNLYINSISINTNKKNEKSSFIKLINTITYMITFYLFIIFILNFNKWSSNFTVNFFIFISISLFIFLTEKQLKIMNNFKFFIIFWGLFFMILKIYLLGYEQLIILISIFFCLIIIPRLLISKNFNILLSSPIEILSVFCMIIFFKFSNLDLKTLIIVSITSLIFYYTNKESLK
jgi:hypothetical protein